ncbi:MAG: hypothetical protein A4E57_04585 [Syntrophorhabdaceae bacterium PtaU1.Bin034]|jgi:hypothetical protein|nr:MAG: hypothetical protein A4E57_04585 [Syntrophorhabdaceae bacterium PtaU1.Bin034]
MLIGKMNRGNRERLMVTVENVKGTKVIDLRVYNVMHDGELQATPAGVSLGADQIDTIIDLLKEAKKKVGERI